MKRSLLAPEVIQSSAMDCGPGALTCLLRGLSIPVSYGRLRTACATDVDGTSIDTLEELAIAHGLQAEQVMLPLDHLPLSAALPAIVVTKMPHGGTHFVVLWRASRSFVQVMDPAVGRRFVRWPRFLEEAYVHEATIPAAAWREWAGSESFLAPLRTRLRELDAAPDALLAAALADPGPEALRHLDAAIRMTAALSRGGALSAGREASALIAALLAEAGRADPSAPSTIPDEYYSARPGPAAEDGEAQLRVRGVVMVQVLGRSEAPAASAEPPPPPEPHPLRLLFQQLDGGGKALGAGLLLLVLASALGASLDPVLLRTLVEGAPQLGLAPARLFALLPCLGLLLGFLAFDGLMFAAALGMGRHLEIRLRAALHARLPRLGDAYFSSRPASDLADRGHQIHFVREVPLLLCVIARAVAQILCTAGLLCALDPRGAALTAALAVVTLLIPFLVQPLLVERDLRARNHQGGLVRFHLDTLLGATPLRAHGAEPALRTSHEDLLSEWATARRSLGRAVLLLLGGQGLATLGGVAALWLSYLGRHRDPSGLLLLAYLSLSLPALGHVLSLGLRRYPTLRSSLLRLLEPLSAPLVEPMEPAASKEPDAPPSPGVEVRLAGVQVRAAGQSILSEVELHIPAGAQVAIVGASGAGKSTLLSLLLGFHRAAAGSVQVDGEELEGPSLLRLRRQTIWVDPAVHLHNRSLLDNLRYGITGAATPMAEVLEQAMLVPLLSRLPDGLQTLLGEGGKLVSGGEGQRVRLGRALHRSGTRLVLLDEPFRGLGRADRQELLRRTRERCRGATLLCVTHDVAETLSFDRVLVIEGGRIVEAGLPADLAATEGSRYQALLGAERHAMEQVYGHAEWRRLHLVSGQLREEG